MRDEKILDEVISQHFKIKDDYTEDNIRDAMDNYSDRIIEMMTFDRACNYLGVSKSFMYKMTSAKTIPHYKPNGKIIFFKRSELEAWALSNPIKKQGE